MVLFYIYTGYRLEYIVHMCVCVCVTLLACFCATVGNSQCLEIQNGTTTPHIPDTTSNCPFSSLSSCKRHIGHVCFERFHLPWWENDEEEWSEQLCHLVQVGADYSNLQSETSQVPHESPSRVWRLETLCSVCEECRHLWQQCQGESKKCTYRICGF